MSETSSVVEDIQESKKRKREVNEENLEIDLGAPEPPSKKALRKAKREKNTPRQNDDDAQRSDFKVIGAEDVVPNRGKRSEYGIWIGNLSFTTTKQDLLNFMTSDPDHPITTDNVTRIHLPAGPVKFGKFQNKGFAYIDVADDISLQSALQLSEKLLGGRRVLIKDAKSFEGRPKEAAKEAPGNPPNQRIFVGNLGFETTVEDLEEHLGVCGSITKTQMATFEDSGKCRGYAWVEFEQLSSAQAAMRGWIEENHQDDNADSKPTKRRVWLHKLGGRKLRMEYAEDKTTRYNKRFGKKAPADGTGDEAPAIEEVATSYPAREKRATDYEQDQSTSGSTATQRQARKGRTQRYTDDTIKKLTGAIVEGQGQRVTFE